jgi:hypothetical protein
MCITHEMILAMDSTFALSLPMERLTWDSVLVLGDIARKDCGERIRTAESHSSCNTDFYGLTRKESSRDVSTACDSHREADQKTSMFSTHRAEIRKILIEEECNCKPRSEAELLHDEDIWAALMASAAIAN